MKLVTATSVLRSPFKVKLGTAACVQFPFKSWVQFPFKGSVQFPFKLKLAVAKSVRFSFNVKLAVATSVRLSFKVKLAIATLLVRFPFKVKLRTASLNVTQSQGQVQTETAKTEHDKLQRREPRMRSAHKFTRQIKQGGLGVRDASRLIY